MKRVTGANDDQVAAALGDRDTRMGRHYSRHVEQENKIIYLFANTQWRNRTNPDLENVGSQDGKPDGSTMKIVKPVNRLSKSRNDKGGL
jgi:hypothetical protein